MWTSLKNLPLFLLLTGIGALSMYVPAAHALVLESHTEARAFFYSGTLFLLIVGLIALAQSARQRKRGDMGNLLALFGCFTFLPVMLAVPFFEAVRTTTFLNAYVEMVSSLTTTGATLFDPQRLTDTQHLWRAQVGWMGGLVMWISAAAILAPLNLGGFEVTGSTEPGHSDGQDLGLGRADPQKRILRVAALLFPVYAGLTLALWIMLVIGGDGPLVSLCHAMSVMATSGISPIGGAQNAQSGLAGEAVLALFMLFALSRLSFSGDTVTTARRNVFQDSEFRLGLAIVLAVPLLLLLRHWVGFYDGAQTGSGVIEALRALWGGVFTTLSFLTTTGFYSADWDTAQLWSGLGSPGLILLGLAIVGGGVATTAGGVKLLRIWALYLSGMRELERMVHPSSVGRSGGVSRKIRKQGAYISWIFFMLFALTLSGFTVAFSGLGLSFENAIVLSVSALSTTGPLVVLAPEQAISLTDLGDAAKLVFCAGMILGRLELLAIIALLTSDVWRS
ncbi:potassium transporter TrkG [Thalassovita sp.]|uniref:potassium transporter TrkG n=1 Tax=Thalassovita sp. TaxID=1979401 RepID=UPI0029DE6E97|nr:potassium transporter TrkG [Thalassovita sp.]